MTAFEGLVVQEESWVRLAPNLEASASRMLESLRAEVGALMNWFTQYFSDRLDIPIAATVPNAVMVLIRRAFELRLYDEIIDLVHSVDPAYRSAGCSYQLADATLAAVRKLKGDDGLSLPYGGSAGCVGSERLWRR